jgi:hypothetical protein
MAIAAPWRADRRRHRENIWRQIDRESLTALSQGGWLRSIGSWPRRRYLSTRSTCRT